MEDSFWLSLRLSLQVASVATALIMAVGISAAYFLAIRRFRGKEIVDVLLTLPLVLPPTVTGYYLIVLFGRNGLIGGPVYSWTGYSIMFTWHAAVLASFVVALPLMIKTTRAAIESVDQSFIHASYTLGRTKWETAIRVILPLSKKGIIAGVVLSFARAMGEFGATLMVAGNIPGKTNTMPLSIYSFVSDGDWPKANVLVIVLTVLSGTFLYVANKFSQRAI